MNLISANMAASGPVRESPEPDNRYTVLLDLALEAGIPMIEKYLDLYDAYFDFVTQYLRRLD